MLGIRQPGDITGLRKQGRQVTPEVHVVVSALLPFGNVSKYDYKYDYCDVFIF